MKRFILLYLPFTLFVLIHNSLFSQDIPLKAIEANFRVNTKEVPLIIRTELELRSAAELASNIDSLLRIIDFSKEYYIFTSFFHGGPSYCNQTYYEYRLQDSINKLIIKPHIVGENASRRHKQTLLIAPKLHIADKLKQSVEEKHYSNFQTKEDIDNICRYLETKFSTKTE